jgi:hypothetical protein
VYRRTGEQPFAFPDPRTLSAVEVVSAPSKRNFGPST